METGKVDIEQMEPGRYRITYKESLAVTSQGLLEIAAWVEAHKAGLELEAQEEVEVNLEAHAQEEREQGRLSD
jgi:hypothetical protein